MITLIREEPTLPLYAHNQPDGRFTEMDGTRTPEQAARDYAWDADLRKGASVWVGWGPSPNPDYAPHEGIGSDNFPHLLRHIEEWEVVKVRHKRGEVVGVDVRCCVETA